MKPLVWMDKAHQVECSVSSSLRLILILSRLVGIAPVSFKKQNGWHISVSPMWSLLSLVVISGLNACTFTGLTFDMQEDIDEAVRGHSTTRRGCWAILVALVMTTASLATYGAPKRMTVMIKCLNQIQKINKTVISKNAPQNTGKKKNKALIISILVFLVVCISDYLNLLNDTLTTDKNVLTVSLYSCYYIACLLMMMFMLQFILTTLEVRSTLGALNAQLKSLQPSATGGSEYFNGEFTDPIRETADETIRNVCIKFDAVCHVIEQQNACDGPALLILLITCVAQLVLSPYLVVINMSQLSVLSYYLKAAQFAWIAFYPIWIFFIVEPCHWAHREMSKSSVLVSKLAITRTNEAISFELEKFSRFLFLNQVAYSPMGLCTLSRSFLATVISAVLTYLILMIQFQTET